MKNMERIIKCHNKLLLRRHQAAQEPAAKLCNCRSKDSCPLSGKCLAESLVYKATLRSGTEEYHYVGMTEGTFKQRYTGHMTSFRHDKYRTATKLSEKVWALKDSGLDYHIDWSIVRRGHGYKAGQRSCDLCTSEKLEILLRSSDLRLLNSRTEILAKCRHKRKFLL